MVHHGQRLAFGIEAGQHRARVHPRLDQLDGHVASDRLPLFGQPDGPHAPFADRFDQLVAPGDHRAGLDLAGRGLCRVHRWIDMPRQQTARIVVGPQQGFDTLAEGLVGPTRCLNKRRPLVTRAA